MILPHCTTIFFRISFSLPVSRIQRALYHTLASSAYPASDHIYNALSADFIPCRAAATLHFSLITIHLLPFTQCTHQPKTLSSLLTKSKISYSPLGESIIFALSKYIMLRSNISFFCEAKDYSFSSKKPLPSGSGFLYHF